MISVIPKRTFLLRQERGSNGTKDVIAERGIKMSIDEKDAIQFWGSLEISDADKAKLMKRHKTQGDYLNSVGRIV
jgi:hypothetical protein